ncbi:SDR family oxidoreductase [Micromonospora sp. NPDC050200]|uniref:SDR family NAD(P)-dependent oxidoreductase n=1 Tax=Micromonospora sp. NPDC050200 TaxID=3155664 RepID=UPI0033F9FCE4
MTRPKPLWGVDALVTGGAGGFGRACALRLARDGAAVTLMGRTAPALRRAAAEITDALPDADVDWIVGDATSAADMAAAVEHADRTALGVCVATVGGGTVRPVLMLDEETLHRDFERNVVSALLAIRHAGAAMAARGGGSIVCLSSSEGGAPFPFMPAYSVAKAALEALVRVSADELGHLGVRVNAVRPGLVPTDAEKPALLVADPRQRATVLAEKPLSRVGTTDDIAEAVRYLARPESSWVTGAVLPVEGGNHLRRAPRLEALARSICGDGAIDRALSGRLPE